MLQKIRGWSFEELFGDRIQKDPRTGCMLFTDHLLPNGYGGITHAYKLWLAHILAYTVVNGPVPKGLEVDHICRVRHCVNPEHLEATTRSENHRRGLQGKLTADDIIKIRESSEAGARGKDLALKYGVSQALISMIIHRKTSWDI